MIAWLMSHPINVLTFALLGAMLTTMVWSAIWPNKEVGE